MNIEGILSFASCAFFCSCRTEETPFMDKRRELLYP
jgi:hypothetical protein